MSERIGSITKRVVLILFLVLAGCRFAFSQFQLPEIDRVKEIKLLESDRFDVQRILYDFESDSWNDSDHSQRLSTENFSVEISYSPGNCDNEDEIWDVPEWKVTKIEISPSDEPIPIKSLGFDISSLEKEREYADIPESYIYYRKDKGVAFEVHKNKVGRIYLLPSKSSKAQMCKNETAERFASSRWFSDSKLEDRTGIISDPTTDIIDLTLSVTKFGFTEGDKEVAVTTTATAVDPENDVLTYVYNVSAGKIVGEGSRVIWDLNGVGPGTYKITAGVDDGCGVCGKTMTKTVIIK